VPWGARRPRPLGKLVPRSLQRKAEGARRRVANDGVPVAAWHGVSSKASSVSTTTVPDPSGTATNPNFGVPGATNPVLEPCDPRACNASDTGPASAP
jgi:hypothetical protein